MRGSALCLISFMMHLFSDVSAVGKYTVIAPGTIHSNDKYTVAVAVHHVTESCQIKVGITGPSFNETKVVELRGNEIEQVDFELPELEWGAYNLTAEGVNCLGDFRNSTRLNYAKVSPYVCFQTDRSAYKPGDQINYRVIFLDNNLRPAKPEKDATIWFEDANRNRIKEIRDFTVTKGVYTGKFNISEHPVMGMWSMGVSNGARYYRNARFFVGQNVLQKYELTIEATKSVSVRDGDIQVIVRANNTYGKPVNGRVFVVFNLGYDDLYFEINNEKFVAPPPITSFAPMIQGKAKVDLNVKEVAAFWPYKKAPYFIPHSPIVATVEEDFTGVKINGTVYTNIFPYRYAISCYGLCHVFIGDKEKEITVRLSHVDGSDLKDTKNPVEITFTERIEKFPFYSSYYLTEHPDETITEEPVSQNRHFSYMGYMNETGFMVFKVFFPFLEQYEGYSHTYEMQFSYLDEKRVVKAIVQDRLYNYGNRPEKEESKLSRRKKRQLATETENPKYSKRVELKLWPIYNNQKPITLHQPFNISIGSNVPLTYIDYNVIGNGNILESGYIKLAADDVSMVYNLPLTPTFSWAPRFSVYAYYVDDNGEYHYAEEAYYVPSDLENEITITAAEQVKPGDEVTLKIKTTPNSLVALLAVDERAVDLSSSLKYDRLRSKNEFGCWISGGVSTHTPDQGGSSYYPGSNSGCVTLTNADFFYNATRRGNFVPNKYENIVQNVEYRLTSQLTGGIPDRNDIIVRDYSDTWFIADIENTETEEFTWSKKIPDTMTSWVISAFAMNSEKGLAVTKEKTKITSLRTFFISIRLPYSVKRGEAINIPCSVFNYLNNDLNVTVTLDNTDGEFDFTEVNNQVIGDQKRSKIVRVPASSAAQVSFLIIPNALGNIMLKFIAISSMAGDTIHKTMKVVPEGITQYANRAYFVNLKNEPEQKAFFYLELPEDIVSGSQRVEVGVVGDILAPVLKNLDSLVRLPTDCGEQTMSTLLPNYLLMKYFQYSNRLTSSLETKLRYNMEQGYQHLLKFHNDDGSFSAFGVSHRKNNPENGSTWLTAYFTRSLIQLQEFVYIDPKIVEGGLEYLAKQQAPNGTFTEMADYFYVSQSNHISVTSSVLLALLQNETLSTKYSKEIEKASQFIADNEAESKSLHAEAIATYALSKAKHSSAKEKLSKLRSLSKTNADHMWWSPEDRPSHSRWWHYIYSNDVEISSYALLSILMDPSSTLDEVYPVVRWLVAQRNSYGGFGSTQDTVVGLTALIEFAKKANYEPAMMDVDVSSSGEAGDKKETIKLNENNGIIYQSLEMPPETKTIEYSAKGSGMALVQISYQYNVMENDPMSSFTINSTKYDSEGRTAYFRRQVCVKYVGDGKCSNMAILEIDTPSGYEIEHNSLKAINELERVGNTELKNADSKLIIYYDHLYKDEEVCLKFEAIRTHAVAMQKPVPMVLYDYYEPTKKVTEFYEVQSKLCDICEGEEECSKCK